MTRIYDAKGKAIPVTVIQAGPVYVTQIQKKEDKISVQVGYGYNKHINKPEKGHLAKTGIDKSLKELKEYHETTENADKIQVGDEINVSIFEEGDIIDVMGVSKGKGFAGTIKRHHFTRGPKTHGSHNYRQPGSIGSAYPQRVFKGVRMAGHMGHTQITVKKLKVMEVHPSEKLLIVSGAIPGARGTLVVIKEATSKVNSKQTKG